MSEDTDEGVSQRIGDRGLTRRSALRLAGASVAGAGFVGRTGATLPDRWFSVSRWSGFRSVLRAGDGHLLTGIQTNGDDEQCGWAVRLDGDGDTVWNRTYQSPPHLQERYAGEDHDGFEFSLPDGDGGFLLVGWWHTLGSDSRYGWLVRVDRRGRPRWSRTYNRSDVNSFRDDWAGGVRTEDGYLLVGRTIASEFLDEETGDGWAVKVSSDGRIEWERAYNTDGATNDGFGDDDRHAEFSGVVRAGSGYLVVGEASPDGPSESTNTAGWALRLNADGDVQWSRTYRLDSGADNEFRGVAATDDGYVFAGVSGEEEYVRPLHDYQMQGTGWVVGVDSRGRVRWEDDGGTGFHAVAPSASGVVLAGARGGRGWAVEYDDAGDRTGRARREEAGDSEYAGVARDSDGHLLAGYGSNGGDTDGLIADLGPGGGTGDDDGDDGADDGDDDGDEQGRLFEIVATEQGDVGYEFTVNGSVEGVRVDGRVKAEDDDAIESNGDGTVTVSGFTGNTGYGDAFRVTGEIIDFERTRGDADFVLRLDGEEVSVAELRGGDGDGEDGDSEDDGGNGDDFGTRLLEIVATEQGDVEYRFVVEGDVEGVRLNDRVKAESNDEISARGDTTVVDGYTGNTGYGDAFEVSGRIVEFERTGGGADYVLRLDGEEVAPGEVVD